MMRHVAVRAVRVAMAGALLHAGVAFACPDPPGDPELPPALQCTLDPPAEQDCTPSGALDLDVAIKQGVKNASGQWVVKLQATRDYGWGGVNVCDAMVRFQVSDDAAVSDVTATLPGSPGTALRNVRITKVERTSTVPSATNAKLARYGSGAFCLWATEDNSTYTQVYRATVEAFDPQGNVHKGQAVIAMTCTVSASGTTSQTAYYQFNVNANGTKGALNADFCAQMNECTTDATLPATCGPTDVCACSDTTTTPPPVDEPPATPGNVCIDGGDRVVCGPVVPTVPGTPPGEVCISHEGTTICGPVNVCVETDDGIVCGPATGPGDAPGEVCISHEGTVCGPVAGSGSGPGNSGGDVCVSHEGTVCGPVSTGGGDDGSACPAGHEGGCDDTGTDGSHPGDVCVSTHESVICDQVPMVSTSTTGTQGSTVTETGATPKTGCAAFPGADLGMGLLALLGLGALRRRR